MLFLVLIVKFTLIIGNKDKSELTFRTMKLPKLPPNPADEWIKEIEKVFDWNPGSVLVWNRTNLHSSSNYIKDGVKSKLGLAIFTVRK